MEVTERINVPSPFKASFLCKDRAFMDQSCPDVPASYYHRGGNEIYHKHWRRQSFHGIVECECVTWCAVAAKYWRRSKGTWGVISVCAKSGFSCDTVLGLMGSDTMERNNYKDNSYLVGKAATVAFILQKQGKQISTLTGCIF